MAKSKPSPKPKRKYTVSDKVLAANKSPRGGASRKTVHRETVIETLAAQGFNLHQIAAAIDVNRKTLWRWFGESKRLRLSYQKGAALRNVQVTDALHARAVGMVLPDSAVTQYQGNVTITPIEKHLAPSELAQIFWLKNRLPAEWADRTERSETVTIAGLPEAALERMRALARAKNGFGPGPKPAIELAPAPEPAPEPAKDRYWNDY